MIASLRKKVSDGPVRKAAKKVVAQSVLKPSKQFKGTSALFRNSAYTVVASSIFGRALSISSAFILVVSFFVTPISDVYASEIADSVATTELSAPSQSEAASIIEETTTNASEEEVVATEEVTSVVTEVTTTDPIEAVFPSAVEEELPTGESNSQSETETATTTPEIVEETPIGDTPIPGTGTTTATSTVPTTEIIATTTEETPEVLPETATTTLPETATTTAIEEVASTTEMIVNHTTDANLYSFSSAECVPVGEGAFHCVKHESGDASQSVNKYMREVFSAPDAEGDMEIYHVVDGVALQITNNSVDDGAPNIDSDSGDIVWHALINDRYQIMHYSKKAGLAVQITDETFNNMQPSIYDGVIVWQAWKGDDWEIVEKDGEELTILTDNNVQDITPSIQAEYISWQSDQNGEWKAKIYNRITRHIDTVSGIDGGKVENPRMVLVFENAKENGDVETVGYDPQKGEAIALGSLPAPMPTDVPVPPSQEEEKALIQPTVTPKVETKATSTPLTGGTDGSLVNATTTPDNVIGTTTATTTEVISDFIPDFIPNVIPNVLETEPVATTTTPVFDVTHIDEIVIPAYEPATTTEQ